MKGQSLARAGGGSVRSGSGLGWVLAPPGLEVGESRDRDSLPPPTLSTSLPGVGPGVPRRGEASEDDPPRHHSSPLLTALTLPAGACVLPRAWLSCTLIQPRRWGAGELFLCVQRGAERTGLRALRTRTMAKVLAPRPRILDPAPSTGVCKP